MFRILRCRPYAVANRSIIIVNLLIEYSLVITYITALTKIIYVIADTVAFQTKHNEIQVEIIVCYTYRISLSAIAEYLEHSRLHSLQELGHLGNLFRNPSLPPTTNISISNRLVFQGCY